MQLVLVVKETPTSQMKHLLFCAALHSLHAWKDALILTKYDWTGALYWNPLNVNL